VKQIAVLFARADSVYKTLPGCDVWDIERDARNWPGGCPVVAHPPCRAWGQFAMFAKPRDDEKALAPWAIEQVRESGGVLEHPAGSKLWPELGLPAPGSRDDWGGWTLPIHQHWWGHRAQKATKLYIVGCEPQDIPTVPYRMHEPVYVIGDVGRAGKGKGNRPEVSKAEREHTPPDLACWLVELARRCEVSNRMEQYLCRCGHLFALELGKYGCANCCGDSGPAKLKRWPWPVRCNGS